QCLFQRHRPAQRLAVDVLQHQEIRADVVNLTDMRMIQRRNRPSFLLKASAVRGFEPLERDYPAKPRVAGPPHLTHATSTNECQDFVRAEFLASGKGHA